MLNLLPPTHPFSRRIGRKRRRRWWKWPLVILTGAVLAYSLTALAVFFAVRWRWTDVEGVVDPNTEQYNQLALELASEKAAPDKMRPRTGTPANASQRSVIRRNCQLDIVRQVLPRNAVLIRSAIDAGASEAEVVKMLFAVSLRLPKNSASAVAFQDCLRSETPPLRLGQPSNESVFPWANQEEFQIVADAFRKDAETINRVSLETGVPSRLIVAVAMVEQLRLYFTQRELFEKFFRPLKILGNATQFAWGVMAIKEKSAIQVERHAADRNSSFYPGDGMAELITLPVEGPEKERFRRLTDEQDHVYSYRYGAIELREFAAQWERAGFPVDDRPEILATLFNIGFDRSRPNARPQTGGSTVTIAGEQYTFGSLAFEWYYSGEMQDVFPLPGEGWLTERPTLDQIGG